MRSRRVGDKDRPAKWWERKVSNKILLFLLAVIFLVGFIFWQQISNLIAPRPTKDEIERNYYDDLQSEE